MSTCFQQPAVIAIALLFMMIGSSPRAHASPQDDRDPGSLLDLCATILNSSETVSVAIVHRSSNDLLVGHEQEARFSLTWTDSGDVRFFMTEHATLRAFEEHIERAPERVDDADLAMLRQLIHPAAPDVIASGGEAYFIARPMRRYLQRPEVGGIAETLSALVSETHLGAGGMRTIARTMMALLQAESGQRLIEPEYLGIDMLDDREAHKITVLAAQNDWLQDDVLPADRRDQVTTMTIWFSTDKPIVPLQLRRESIISGENFRPGRLREVLDQTQTTTDAPPMLRTTIRFEHWRFNEPIAEHMLQFDQGEGYQRVERAMQLFSPNWRPADDQSVMPSS